MPLAIVRWTAANADAPNAAGSDKGTRAANGPKPTSRAATQSTANANDTDRPPLLPPELLSLKDRYPEQWAKLEVQRRKLARQLGQSPEPEAPTPPKPEVFHVHVDHLGTPREITDTDGHLVWTANYAAWGKAVTTNPPRRIITRQGNMVAEVVEEQAEPLECNLRFQGQYADAESGLHYNRFRYYETGIGRFINHDPVGLTGGLNKYRLAPNSVNFIDPLGLSCKPCLPAPCARLPGQDIDPLLAPAKRNTGVTVLGHYPAYTNLANEIGARYFQIPPIAWDKLVAHGDPWVVNEKFLQRTLARGDQIVLATPLDSVKPGSYFERELRFLSEKGFIPCPDGVTLRRTP